MEALEKIKITAHQCMGKTGSNSASQGQEDKMIDTLSNNIVNELANVLLTNAVDSNNISKSLALICEFFDFDGAMIYEINHYNNMILKESCSTCEINMELSFPIEDIDPKCRQELAFEGISYINSVKDKNNSKCKFLNLFEVSSLVIVSLIDRDMRIIGFLILFNKNGKVELSISDKKALEAALHMLSRYIEIRIYQQKLTYVQTSFESILDNTGVDIYVNDFSTHDILYINKSMAAPYGGVDKFKGKKCWEVLFPTQGGPCEFCPQKELIDDEGNPTKVYTWDYQRARDGSWFRVFSAAFRWGDGRLAHVVSSTDITDNKRNEELINYMANYDSLTQLPNRRKLIADLEDIISKVDKEHKFYVLFFDIDGFKVINDSFGHDAGDEFLVQFGQFFNLIPELQNSVYRHGGDEFVAIVKDNISEVMIKSLISQIHQRFSNVWKLKKGEVNCTTSVGVSCYPEDGKTVERLLYNADIAMYQIKKAGGGDMCFKYQLKDSE